MKKIFLILVFVMTIVLCASAQTDGFFRGGGDDMERTTQISNTTPLLPQGSVGLHNTDQAAPLGSGLLLLTALGAGYALKKNE